MNDDKTQEIINFINVKYDKEVPPRASKIFGKKIKKIKTLEPNDFPESFRKCTIEELIWILRCP